LDDIVVQYSRKSQRVKDSPVLSTCFPADIIIHINTPAWHRNVSAKFLPPRGHAASVSFYTSNTPIAAARTRGLVIRDAQHSALVPGVGGHVRHMGTSGRRAHPPWPCRGRCPPPLIGAPVGNWDGSVIY